MAEHYPQAPFERYADDAIVHCRNEVQAQEIRNAIAARLKECGLELHPDKTKVVYCKDDLRRRTYPNEKFDFLGYTFRPRRSKNREGKHFINFSPAISDQAVKAIRAEIRSWDLPERSDKGIRRSVTDVQSGDSGLASILLTVLSFGALPADAATRSLIGSLGLSKVQKVAWTSAEGETLDRTHRAS